MRNARALVLSMVALVSATSVACGNDVPDPPAGARTIRIETPDGEMLSAIDLGRSERVAVLSHGATGTKEDFYELASAFHAAGWRAIAYNARGVGTSTGMPGADRESDLRAVVGYARNTGAKAVLLAGGSLGASLSISMARELNASAVVSLSAPAAAFDALDAAREIDGDIPVFVAAARENEPFASDARAIAAVLDVSPTIIDGNGHGSGMLRDDPRLTVDVIAFADASVARGA